MKWTHKRQQGLEVWAVQQVAAFYSLMQKILTLIVKKNRLLKSFKSWQLKSHRRGRVSVFVCVAAVSPLYSRDQ